MYDEVLWPPWRASLGRSSVDFGLARGGEGERQVRGGELGRDGVPSPECAEGSGCQWAGGMTEDSLRAWRRAHATLRQALWQTDLGHS